jgi:hypothetical protein
MGEGGFLVFLPVEHKMAASYRSVSLLVSNGKVTSRLRQLQRLRDNADDGSTSALLQKSDWQMLLLIDPTAKRDTLAESLQWRARLDGRATWVRFLARSVKFFSFPHCPDGFCDLPNLLPKECLVLFAQVTNGSIILQLPDTSSCRGT